MEISKWIISTRNKLKLAFVLIVVAGLLLAANRFAREQVASIDQSFLSIYADRLVPATTIFEIREHLYKKHTLLTGLLHSGTGDIQAHKKGIDSCNHGISSLLSAYKKTYFLEKEAGFLQVFEENLQQYNQVENFILSRLGVIGNESPEVLVALERDAYRHFNNAIHKLSDLSHIQSEIGKDMLSDSKKTMASFLLLSNLETILIVLFGLIAHVLIYASRAVIQRRVDTFHMN